VDRRVLIPVLVLALLTLALAPLAQGGWALTVTHKINVHPSIQERGWREAFCYNHITSKTYHYDFWVKELEGADVVVTPVPPTSSGGAVATSNAIVIGNGTARWVDVYAVLPRGMASEPVHHVVVEIVDKTHDVTCWDPETGNVSGTEERTITEHALVDGVDLGEHVLYRKPSWAPATEMPPDLNGTIYVAVAAPIGAHVHVEDPVVPEPQPSPPLPPGGNTTTTPVPPTTSNSTTAPAHTATTPNTTTPRGSAVHVSPALLGLGAIAALFLLLARR